MQKYYSLLKTVTLSTIHNGYCGDLKGHLSSEEMEIFKTVYRKDITNVKTTPDNTYCAITWDNITISSFPYSWIEERDMLNPELLVKAFEIVRFNSFEEMTEFTNESLLLGYEPIEINLALKTIAFMRKTVINKITI